MIETNSPLSFEVVAAEFARRALAGDVPAIVVIGVLAGVAADLAVQAIGADATRTWLRDIADRLEHLEQDQLH